MSDLAVFNFHGDELDVLHKDGRVWVSVRRVCEALGMASNNQVEKLKNKPWAVSMMIISTGRDGKSYSTFCVDLDCLPMWLATLDTNRIPASKRPRIELYQVQCANVLRDHFFGQPASAKASEQATEITIRRSMEERMHAQQRQLDRLNGFMGALIKRGVPRNTQTEMFGLSAPSHAVRIVETTIGRKLGRRERDILQALVEAGR